MCVETEIFEILNQFTGDNVDYLPNFGNIGDTLIYMSTIKLFNDHEINYNLNINDSNTKRATLFISGGGNLVDYYSSLLNMINCVYKNYENVVLLPHTIYGNNSKKFFSKIGENFIICCRERISYDFLYSIVPFPKNLFLCKDLAFYYDYSKFVANGIGNINCFRVDIEGTRVKIPKDNIDLSQQIQLDGKPFFIDYWNTNYWAEYLNVFLTTISKCESVSTNRLHVAIAASLMNKKVDLYPNAYFKNEAVYRYSLSKLPNVIWVDKNR